MKGFTDIYVDYTLNYDKNIIEICHFLYGII